MAQLAPRDRASLAALAATIATRRCDDASLAPALAEVAYAVDARAVVVFSVRDRQRGPELERLDVAGVDARLFATVFGRELAARAWDGGELSGELTPRRGRNRVEDADPRADLGGLWNRVLAPFGLHDRPVLRAPIHADEPLGWIATVHRDPPPSSARRQLTALLPPLAERLAFDRRAARHALLDDVVEALLEELPQPVFAVAATGHIELANGHARRWLARDREGTLSTLRDALAGKPAGVPVRTLRLAATTLVCFELADAEARLDERVDRTAERLQLTQRQRDVLRLVARGCSNATIADRLSICARAVEFHVTAILDRAAVDNRASIISHVLAHD